MNIDELNKAIEMLEDANIMLENLRDEAQRELDDLPEDADEDTIERLEIVLSSLDGAERYCYMTRSDAEEAKRYVNPV